jgi:O-antigen/teichoic acid export membrane protein
MSEVVNSSLKTAARGTAFILLGTSLSNLIWFGTKFLIIRNITAEQLGIYSLAIAVVSVLSLVGSLGVHEGATKYISIFLGEGKEADAAAVRTASIQIGILSGTAAFALLFFLSGPISKYFFYKPEVEIPLKIISCYIPFSVVSLILVWILRGYGLIRARVYYLEIGMPLFFLLFLSVFLALKLPFLNIFYAYALSGLVVFIAVGSYGYRRLGVIPLPMRGGAYHKQLLQFSLSILFLSAMLVVFGSTDTFMLGRYVRVEEVGIYNIAIFMATLLTFPYNAVSFVFMPIAGDLFAKKQTRELKRTYQILTRWLFLTSLPIFFVLFFFPEITVTFLFGNKFIASAMPLRLLSVGFLVQSFLGVNSVLMIVLGLSRAIRRTAVFAAIVNILLSYGFIKLLGYGILGASLGTMLSYVLLGATNLLIVYKNSGIHPFSVEYLKPLAMSCISGLVIYLVAKALPLYPWMLPIYLALFVGGYLLSILLTRSIDKEELRIFSSIAERLGLSTGFVKYIERFTK